MYNNQRIVALIPARGGSKGIKHKNIIDLAGKPLIVYSIDAAKNSQYIDDIIVTTDSEKIASVARENGAMIPFMRPGDLAQDNSRTVDAVIHAVNELKNQGSKLDVLVLLQPTQPLRTAEDVDKAIEKFFACDCRPLVSVSSVKDHPILIRSINEQDELVPLLNVCSTCRRQDMPPFYRVNGCIYINRVDELTIDTSFNDNIIPFIMEKSHSVDIDEYIDLAMAELYINQEK